MKFLFVTFGVEDDVCAEFDKVTHTKGVTEVQITDSKLKREEKCCTLQLHMKFSFIASLKHSHSCFKGCSLVTHMQVIR